MMSTGPGRKARVGSGIPQESGSRDVNVGVSVNDWKNRPDREENERD